MIPSLNEMYAKYAEQGLVIVGVTDESGSTVDGSLKKDGQTYPIGMVKGGSADAAYGVSGFPTVVLVGPDGNVLTVDKRHPEAEIKEALKRAVLIPTLEGKSYSSVNKAIKAKQLGKALVAIEKMLVKTPEDSQLLDAKTAIEKSFTGRYEGAIAQAEKGGYGGALDALETIQDLYKGYGRTAEASAKAKEIKKDPKAKDDIAAHSMLRKAKADFAKGKKANRASAIKTCEKIIAKYPNTPTADKARAMKGSAR
jgi:tetratricopeptide (TPR) repeat protein